MPIVRSRQQDENGRRCRSRFWTAASLLASNHLEESFRHLAMLALAVMEHMKKPIWNLQSHLVKQACLYARHRHGSGNRGGAHAGLHR